MLALLFPGQGSQEVGMGRDVYEASPAAREVFETADAALGYSLSKLCFDGPEDELLPTSVQQPAILTTSVALLRAIEEQGPVEPAFVAGHSLGEYSALVASGALAFDDAVRLVQARGRFMQEAVPEGRGAMAAVIGSDAATVARCCADAARETGAVVAPANYNSPPQTVIAGDAAAVERACALAREAGASRTVPLPVSAPFHCELMARAAEKLSLELAGVRFSDPARPVVTNVEARANREGGRIAALLEQQVTAPVRFVEMVEYLASEGVTRVLEVGPGRVLTGLVRRIDRGIERANCSGQDEVVEAAAFAAASCCGSTIGGGSDAMSTDLESRVMAIVAEQLGATREEIVPEASFIEDLGADSLDIVELVMAMEEAFDVEIPDDDAEKIQTFGDAVAYLRDRVEA